jgi:hypothetical protein
MLGIRRDSVGQRVNELVKRGAVTVEDGWRGVRLIEGHVPEVGRLTRAMR